MAKDSWATRQVTGWSGTAHWPKLCAGGCRGRVRGYALSLLEGRVTGSSLSISDFSQPQVPVLLVGVGMRVGGRLCLLHLRGGASTQASQSVAGSPEMNLGMTCRLVF